MKPCKHENAEAGCRLCELAETRDDYRKLWGLPPLPKPSAPPVDNGKFSLLIVTCPGREASLGRTIESVHKSDWPAPPFIHIQPKSYAKTYPNIWDRTSANYKDVLRSAAALGREWSLIIEDDVSLCDNLFHNLSNWWPLRQGDAHYASLFMPETIKATWTEINEERAYRIPHERLHKSFDGDWLTNRLYGSQAYLFSRKGLEGAIENWDRHTGGQDARAIGVAGQLGWKFYYPIKSWVQHEYVGTMFDTPNIRADVFDPSHKLPVFPTTTFPAHKGDCRYKGDKALSGDVAKLGLNVLKTWNGCGDPTGRAVKDKGGLVCSCACHPGCSGYVSEES